MQPSKPNHVEEALQDLHAIARTLANRTDDAPAGKPRALDELDAILMDSTRILDLARRARDAHMLAFPPQLDLFAPPPPPALARERFPVDRSLITRCKSSACNAPIVYLNRAGRAHPVDAGTVRLGETAFDPKHHTSHFATCPDANSFRGGRHG